MIADYAIVAGFFILILAIAWTWLKLAGRIALQKTEISGLRTQLRSANALVNDVAVLKRNYTNLKERVDSLSGQIKEAQAFITRREAQGW